MRTTLTLTLTLAAAATLAACGDGADINGPDAADAALSAVDASRSAAHRTGEAGAAAYRVTITSLVAEGQPLTPPLVAAHRRPMAMFSVGEPASFGLKEIAENGNLAPMHERLAGARHVTDVQIVPAGTPPPILPGEGVELELVTERGAKYFSFVSMLICTNDGFTGVNGMRLPDEVDETVVVHAGAYDAGTEQNTEDFADMVPPCPVLTGVESSDEGTGMSDPALAEGGVVRHHPGITGIADLDAAVHGWTDPVVRVEVTRVR